jgi:hypothetical protein
MISLLGKSDLFGAQPDILEFCFGSRLSFGAAGLADRFQLFAEIECRL